MRVWSRTSWKLWSPKVPQGVESSGIVCAGKVERSLKTAGIAEQTETPALLYSSLEKQFLLVHTGFIKYILPKVLPMEKKKIFASVTP